MHNFDYERRVQQNFVTTAMIQKNLRETTNGMIGNIEKVVHERGVQLQMVEETSEELMFSSEDFLLHSPNLAWQEKFKIYCWRRCWCPCYNP
jgi:hypothetical protein